MKDFLNIIKERGFLYQATDIEALEEKFKQGKATGYIGFDLTADSLHVGSLVPLMLLKWMQETGEKPIALLGGATTKIGDPSGKDTVRPVLSHDYVENNKRCIKRIIDNFIPGIEFVDNIEWLGNLGYIEVLEKYGRYFSINRMLTFDSVAERLKREQPLTFLEFNYMVLQAVDFVFLYQKYGCILQMGGSDQWGNIVSGVDLGKRVGLKENLYGVTSPLVTTSDGKKMGKTAEGAVWIDKNRLSPYDYWQFWRNVSDADTIKFLKLFTMIPMAEIEKMAKLQGQEINEAKKILADHATAMVHGDGVLEEIHKATAALFGGEGLDSSAIPTIEFDKNDLGNITLPDLLAKYNLTESKGEARRLIRSNAIRINDIVITDEAKVIDSSLFAGNEFKISSGKKKHFIVKIS